MRCLCGACPPRSSQALVNEPARAAAVAAVSPRQTLLRVLLHPGRIARGASVDAVETLVAEPAAFAPAGDPDHDELAVGALGEQRAAVVAGAGVALGPGTARADHV